MNDYQRNILNAQLFYKDTAIENIGGVLAFSVEISYEDVCAILGEMIAKTASLRFRLGKDGEFYEWDDRGYTVENVLISGDYEKAVAYAESRMRMPFSSIYDTRLFELQYIAYDSGAMLFLKLHHLLGDAATIAILCKRFEQGYYALLQYGVYTCQDTPVVYRTASTETKKRISEYFSAKLMSFEPAKLSDRESQNCTAEKISFSMPLYKKHMASEFISALYVYISAITNSSKIALGFVLGNRTKKEMSMVGMFANTLPLVLEFGDGRFEQLNQKVQGEIYNLIKRSTYSLEDLKKYNHITSNIFEISVSYRYADFIPKVDIGELVECFNGCIDSPIQISVEEKERLDFNIYYKKSIFNAKYIENLGNAVISILSQGMENALVSQISVLTALDKKIYERLNDTNKEHDNQDIIECFCKNVTDKPILVWEDGNLSGFELENRSKKIASFIQKKNICRVGIKMERCHEMIEAVVGVLMAGAAFMIVSDSIKNMAMHCDIVLEKSDISEIYEKEYEFTSVQYDPESTAYMVCTSGTTGKPKCIEISRKSLISRLEWAEHKYGLRGSVLQKTVNTFDVSIWEMLSVVYGARLCLLKDGYEKLPDKIAQAMNGFKIEKVHFVPSVLYRFLIYIQKHNLVFPNLKEVYVSGEKLERTVVDCFFEALPGVRLINLYGPAECTIDVSFYECQQGKLPKDIPIGHPVDHTKIYILNDHDKCMPVGVFGEICIFGTLVGKGYRAENIGGYCEIDGVSAYKTGDIGKVDFDGNLYIHGRRDRQVKLRGIRINLSEIKNVILQCAGVEAAEIIKHNNRLECYYCGNADADQIRLKILRQVDANAVPSVFRKIDDFPLTKSGKSDVDALKEMWDTRVSSENSLSQDHSETMSAVEEEILNEVSKYVDADLDDNLFDIGLDSVSVLDIVYNLQEKGYNIEFSDFYENLSVRRIAANIENKAFYTFLKRNTTDRVMICFPYAGGEPQNLIKLSDKINCNIIGVYISAFAHNSSIEEIAQELQERLPLNRFKHIYVYGQCVGCATALEFANRIGKAIRGIILVVPAVRKEKKTHLWMKTKGKFTVFSPWKLLPNRGIAYLLRRAGGTFLYTKTMIERFRKDTDRYFRYTPHKYDGLQKDCRVGIIFGSADMFTRNREELEKRFRNYISASLNVYRIEGGKHFISETNCDEVYQVIEHQYHFKEKND